MNIINRHVKNSGKQVGIINQDMIHRLDTLTEEAESQNSPYAARRKNSVDNSQMFDESLYSDNQTQEDDDKLSIPVVVAIIVVIAVAVIGVVILLQH